MVHPESLLIRPKRIVDPFGRMGSFISESLLVVEFCQMEGPKPLFVHSSNADRNCLDLDALSVWLMSSETATGTILSLYNQQMAIYAISYHCTFFDILARAFQRPVCFAYLSSEKPSASTLVKFTHSIRQLVSPVLVCNRKLFLATLTDMMSLSKKLESPTSDTLSKEAQEFVSSPGGNHRFKAVSDQVRKIYPRVQKLFQGLNESAYSECHSHSANKDRILETLQHLKKPGVLPPLSEIAPCTFGSLDGSLGELLTHLSLPHRRRGVLYCCSVPVLRSVKVETPIKESKKKEKQSKDYDEREHTLKTLTQHLDNLLYPVLAGEDLIVCGSKQRKRTVVDIVEKLNSLLPRAHMNFSVTSWEEDAMSLPHGVVGLASPKTSSISLPAVSRAVLDVNTNMLRAVPYNGVLLSDLHQRRRFPSDESLISFISAVISRVCCYVYMVRHVPLTSLREEGLTLDDEKIIAYLLTELDIVKYQPQRSALEGRRSNSMVKCINL